MQTRIGLLGLAVATACRTGDRTVPAAHSTTAPVAVETATSKSDTLPAASATQSADLGFDAGGGYRIRFSHGDGDVTRAPLLYVTFVRETAPDSIIEIGTVRRMADNARVLRADTTFIVLSQTSDYGFGDLTKLFLDPKTKKLIKAVSFSQNDGLEVFDDTTAARMLSLPVDVIRGLKEREPTPKPDEAPDAALPKALRDHPMPQPTYKDFAQARPGRVSDGYDSANAAIGEGPGPVQLVGNRIWFGKTFYDGEGESGIGGVGYFDTTTSTYTFLNIPDLVGWSVSAILVDDNDLWIGLVGHPEGADYGGGLLRRDIKNGATRKYEVKDVILSIRRWNNATYLATPTGLLVLANDQITDRYTVEPKIDETFELLHFPGRP